MKAALAGLATAPALEPGLGAAFEPARQVQRAQPANPPAVPSLEALAKELLLQLAGTPATAEDKYERFHMVDAKLAVVPAADRPAFMQRMVQAIVELPVETRLPAFTNMSVVLAVHMNDMDLRSFMNVFHELHDACPCLPAASRSRAVQCLESLAATVPRYARDEATRAVIGSIYLANESDRALLLNRAAQLAMTGTDAEREGHLLALLRNLAVLGNSPEKRLSELYGWIRLLAEMQPPQQHAATLRHLLGGACKKLTGVRRTLSIRGLLGSARVLPVQLAAPLATDLGKHLDRMLKDFNTGIQDNRAESLQVADFRDMADIAKSLDRFDPSQKGTPGLTALVAAVGSADKTSYAYGDALKKILRPDLIALAAHRSNPPA